MAVCIATFRRPAGLAGLLDAIAQLEFNELPDLRIIVVDNDAETADGLRVCAELESYPWPIEAISEPQRGISFARNRGLERALEVGAAAIAFIDDDEKPDRKWLQRLLVAWRTYSAHVVTGPVLPRYAAGTPGWVIEGGFFERPRPASGTELEWARTGNLLLDARFLLSCGLLFDETFARSGGEDTLFTLQLRNCGARIVWADDAVVVEDVPIERATFEYLLRRAFLGGLTWVRVERVVKPARQTRVGRALVAMARVAQGALSIPVSVLRGRHEVVRAVTRSAVGIGALWSLVRDPPPAHKY